LSKKDVRSSSASSQRRTKQFSPPSNLLSAAARPPQGANKACSILAVTEQRNDLDDIKLATAAANVRKKEASSVFEQQRNESGSTLLTLSNRLKNFLIAITFFLSLQIKARPDVRVHVLRA
jgi:hypothetical protein